MKQDKALLPLGGITLLQRQFEKLEALLGRGNALVSGDRPTYPFVRDLEPGLGPLEGLRSVLHSLHKKDPKSSLLVVPVDMPFLTEDILKRLVCAQSDQPITKFKGQQLPFVIHNLSLVLDSLEKFKTPDELSQQGRRDLHGRQNSFKNLFKNISVRELELESDSFFANLNTPEDWNAAIP